MSVCGSVFLLRVVTCELIYSQEPPLSILMLLFYIKAKIQHLVQLYHCQGQVNGNVHTIFTSNCSHSAEVSRSFEGLFQVDLMLRVISMSIAKNLFLFILKV